MKLSEIIIVEMGRENYVESADNWRVNPRSEKKRVIWSLIARTLIYPDYRSLIDDFLSMEHADTIFVKGKDGDYIRHRMSKPRPDNLVDNLVRLAEENELKRSFFELRFVDPSHEFKRDLSLYFIEERGMILLGVMDMPQEYAGWFKTRNKTNVYRYNKAVIGNRCKFIPFKKK